MSKSKSQDESVTWSERSCLDGENLPLQAGPTRLCCSEQPCKPNDNGYHGGWVGSLFTMFGWLVFGLVTMVGPFLKWAFQLVGALSIEAIMDRGSLEWNAILVDTIQWQWPSRFVWKSEKIVAFGWSDTARATEKTYESSQKCEEEHNCDICRVNFNKKRNL